MQGRAGTAATTSIYIIWYVYVTISVANFRSHQYDNPAFPLFTLHEHDIKHNLCATTYAIDDYVTGDTLNTVTPTPTAIFQKCTPLPFNVSRGSTSSECLQVNQTNSTHQ
jgi:hypothetical protein